MKFAKQPVQVGLMVLMAGVMGCSSLPSQTAATVTPVSAPQPVQAPADNTTVTPYSVQQFYDYGRYYGYGRRRSVIRRCVRLCRWIAPYRFTRCLRACIYSNAYYGPWWLAYGSRTRYVDFYNRDRLGFRGDWDGRDRDDDDDDRDRGRDDDNGRDDDDDDDREGYGRNRGGRN